MKGRESRGGEDRVTRLGMEGGEFAQVIIYCP